MYKIDVLDIQSFKFFKDTEPLQFEKKNILIYGENGSGKSTIYWALYTFFQSAIKNNDQDIKKYFTETTEANPNSASLVNIYEDNDKNSKIEIVLKDVEDLNPQKIFTISKENINTNKEDLLIERGCYAGDFINYKYIFRFFDFLHKEDIDLFKLFEYEILHFITSDGQNLAKLWEKILELKFENPRPITNKREFNKLTNELNNFNKLLSNEIEKINRPANDYLQKFGYKNIKLKLEVLKGQYTTQRIFIRPKIKFSIIFQKDEENSLSIPRIQSYFNEAKLTAIALSVRFAITHIKLQDTSLKVLVLDDLLVSLDMSNREIVLDLLINDESFKDFQTIILTHDKAFYEFAKNRFEYEQKNTWKYIKMFLDNKGSFEKPFIVPNRNYFQLAEYYLIKHDYPTCANYLRKESERLLKELVCHKDLVCQETKNLQELIDKAKAKGSLKDKEKIIEDVKKLIQFESFQKFIDFDTNKLTIVDDKRIFGEIRTQLKKFKTYKLKEIEGLTETLKMLEKYKRLILNPQSHDDITTPLYRKELDDAMVLIKQLANLSEEDIVE